MRERRRPVVRPGLVGGVGNEVAAGASGAVVTPDVPQVEPVADLVGGRPPQVVRRRGGSRAAEAGVHEDHPVGGGRTAGELRVAQQRLARAAAQVAADPEVEVLVRRPRVRPTRGGRLHVVGRRTEGSRRGGGAGDAVGRVARRIGGRELERHPRVADQRLEDRGRGGLVGIRRPEVRVEHGDLTVDLRGRHVFRGVAVNDVHDDGDLGAPRSERHPRIEHAGRAILDFRASLGVTVDRAHQTLIDLAGATRASRGQIFFGDSWVFFFDSHFWPPSLQGVRPVAAPDVARLQPAPHIVQSLRDHAGRGRCHQVASCRRRWCPDHPDQVGR